MMKARTYLIYFFLLAFPVFGSGQVENLLRNGSFENVILPDCTSSKRVENITREWYGTASLYADQCAINYQVPSITYDYGFSMPIAGRNTLRIFNRSWGTGNFEPRFAASETKEPLTEGSFYVFSALVNNRGLGHFRDTLIHDCVDEPFRYYQLIVSKEEIQVEQERANDLAKISGSQIAINDSTYIRSQFSSGWKEVVHCFQASGGEQHFAIAGPTGMFRLSENCQAKFSQTKLFHMFLYEFDDLSLYKIPQSDQAAQTICSDEPTPVHLKRLFPHPAFQEATFEWEDGTVDSIRFLQQEGTYLIDANIGCTKIPLELNLEAEECASRLYVPNAFSPNDDGINDILRPHLRTFWETDDYSFTIFDRWGNQLFQTDNPSVGWNGKVDSAQPMKGMYVWVVRYTLLREEREVPIVKSGEIILVQ
jgi:gliding motility-associated-like protein